MSQFSELWQLMSWLHWSSRSCFIHLVEISVSTRLLSIAYQEELKFLDYACDLVFWHFLLLWWNLFFGQSFSMTKGRRHDRGKDHRVLLCFKWALKDIAAEWLPLWVFGMVKVIHYQCIHITSVSWISTTCPTLCSTLNAEGYRDVRNWCPYWTYLPVENVQATLIF